MKKRNFKNLSLSKRLVSNLNSEKVLGGAADSSKSFRLADCPVAESAKQTCQYSCIKRTCYCL